MSFENDLLDLCRLNAMEENIVGSCAPDRNSTMQMIDWKKRQLVTRLESAPAEDSGSATVNVPQQGQHKTPAGVES
jgi:hypothetical protein